MKNIRGENKKLKEEQIVEKHTNQLLFDVKRGFLQFIVLSLIDQGPTYAYEIKEEVFRATGGTFDIDRNNLYKKLRTLEREGILKSAEKPSVQGANRKYYSLTPFGKRFLKEISKLMVPVIDSFYENIRKGKK
jgi:PadR family transcriptional regulator PadR